MLRTFTVSTFARHRSPVTCRQSLVTSRWSPVTNFGLMIAFRGVCRFFPIFTTMKLLVSILFALFSFSAIAQTDITPQVSAALKKGDAAALASYFMSQVELELPDQEGTFSSAEARAVLTKFFASAQVRDFILKHQGTSKLDDQFRIGDMSTAMGSYRVTFFMKKVGTSLQIKQLKIEQ